MATSTGPGRRRAGRPAGSPPNRETILAAARQQFAERGYDSATIRGIAARAGVDPALVHHYFGSKDRLFLAALQLQASPSEVVAEVLEGGQDAGAGAARFPAGRPGTGGRGPAGRRSRRWGGGGRSGDERAELGDEAKPGRNGEGLFMCAPKQTMCSLAPG